jgi:ornithine cyclodeaminase
MQTLGQPPLHQLQAGPDAQVCVKTGYVKDDQVFCLKIAGGGSDYAGNTGMMQVFCQRTLRLQCVLQDEGILTEMRTAAAACVASSLMMPREVAAVGIVGASVQAIWQLRFLRGILPASTRKVVVRSRTQASAAAFRDKMLASPCDLDRGWDIVTYEEAQGAGAKMPFAQCGLIHTVSCAREPVIALTDLLAPDGRRGPVHISAMGADSAGKQELGLDLVENADLLVCDSLVQARERGEFQHYFAAHAGSPPKQVIELGKLLSSPEPVRSKQTQDSLLTIFDSSGVAVQDVCIAKLVSHMLNQAS